MHLIPEHQLSLRSVAALDRALEAYDAITNSMGLLMSQGWSNESIFLSRYFWFKLHASLRAAQFGPDAGLEQQAFQILENPTPSCEPDWNDVAEIEEKILALVSRA